ncbi:MAG: hypothetical protein KDE51_20805 [Anaerolineales bacterium]|nr:hypothetical protein [Anaerolineales bacterium]
MKQKFITLVVTGGLLLLLAAAALSAPTEIGISWWSIDGGGGSSAGGRYALSGSIGQPDAGFQSGSRFSTTGGFWSLTDGTTELYLPVVIR